MNNIVVLASGDGSNLQAVIDACRSGNINGSVDAVVSNNENAYALHRAAAAGIPAYVVKPQNYADRRSYDLALIEYIDLYQPKLVVLAGYMRILTPDFVNRYAGKLINIHPSLLPKYPGLNTHQQALEHHDKEHGCSIHFVTEQLDGGPLILQAKLTVSETDTAQTLSRRVKQLEHRAYPLVINWFMNGRLTIVDNHVLLDNRQLSMQAADIVSD